MDSDAILTAVNAVESITNPPHTPERSSYRARKTVEQIIHLIFLLCGIVAVAFVLLISIYLILSGLPAIRQIGLFQFLLGKVWDPTNTTTGAQYGILPFILTSVYGTAGAIVIGVPVGLLTAVFLAKVAPPKLAAVIRTAVQLLAGIPSVVTVLQVRLYAFLTAWEMLRRMYKIQWWNCRLTIKASLMSEGL